MNKLTKALFFMALISSVMVFSGVIYLDNTLDNEFKVKSGESLSITAPIPITAEYNGEKFSKAGSGYSVKNEFSVDLKAFGLIPISSAKALHNSHPNTLWDHIRVYWNHQSIEHS